MSRRAIVIAAMAAFGGLLTLNGCSDDETTKSPGTGDGGSSSTQGAKLSANFSLQCQRCHGPEGKGNATYPLIPGGKDEAGYVAIVRAGKGDMPAFTTSQITDDDLKNDFAWLTTKRE